MNNKEALEFITKLINFTKEQINYFKNKIVEDEQYPTLQQCHKEKLIVAQEGLTHLHQIKQNLDKLEKLEKALDKAIEKCMKFDKCPPITCIELANDNDNVCKECWKKYFMKEVLGND